MAKYEGGQACDSRAYAHTVVRREELAVHRGRLQDDVVRRDGLNVLRVKPIVPCTKDLPATGEANLYCEVKVVPK